MPILVEVETPDGLAEVEFPDDTDEATITSSINEYVGGFKNMMGGVEDSDIDNHEDTFNEMLERTVNRDQFAEFIAPVIKAEGGFVNDPKDSGGATKYGITIGTLKNYRGTDVSVDDVKALDVDEAIDIYQDRYYAKPKIDLLPDNRIQAMVMDHGVTAGPSNAIRLLQRLVGVEADGRMGPQTAKAVEQHVEKRGVEDLLKRYGSTRKQYYQKVAERRPKDQRFLRGWLNRVDHTLDRLLNNSDLT